jgi:hypothetical protein
MTRVDESDSSTTELRIPFVNSTTFASREAERIMNRLPVVSPTTAELRKYQRMRRRAHALRRLRR